MTSTLFIGWLRGFLDGVGDRDLTKKQVKRIVSEAQALLDPSENEEPSMSEKSGFVETKAKKPLTRAQLLALGKNNGMTSSGDPLPPSDLGDLPKVERQG